MDELLQRRFSLFRGSSGLPNKAITAVYNAINTLGPEDMLTDDRMGMLVSHLIASLARTHKGQSLGDEPPADVQDQVLSDRPELVAQARRLAKLIEEQSGLELPESEVKYVALHLAVIHEKE